MQNYNSPVALIEDTVGEPMKFKSLKAAAHYLYDSDMSPTKPTEISIYTALVYAVKHSNRYKNYTIAFLNETVTEDRCIELIHRALAIMERRAAQEDRSVESRISYTSCIDMIRYALNEDEDCLSQFDY